MKRFFDLFLAIVASIFLCIPMIFIALWVLAASQGPIVYWSDRVGRGNKIFRMPKFRTMQVNTPAVATHLLTDANKYLTSNGSF